MRKLLKRGSFTSVEDLTTKILDFIVYYNRTMAKPFKRDSGFWTRANFMQLAFGFGTTRLGA